MKEWEEYMNERMIERMKIIVINNLRIPRRKIYIQSIDRFDRSIKTHNRSFNRFGIDYILHIWLDYQLFLKKVRRPIADGHETSGFEEVIQTFTFIN